MLTRGGVQWKSLFGLIVYMPSMFTELFVYSLATDIQVSAHLTRERERERVNATLFCLEVQVYTNA